MHHINVEFESFARSHNALRDFGFEEVRARSYAEAPAARAGALPFGDEDTEGGGPKAEAGLRGRSRASSGERGEEAESGSADSAYAQDTAA
jgi:hypothetical protein